MSGAASKRAASEGGAGPPEKKPNNLEKATTTLIEPIRLGGISSTEEMDLKVLQFKNKKLAERLEQRQAIEDELRERIEKLEKRQATDDATLLIVNRYWSQLDENVQVLLHRYDSQTDETVGGDEGEKPGTIPETPDSNPLTDGQEAPETDKGPALSGSPARGVGKEVPAPVPMPEPALSFLATLASSSSEEIELQLQGRMEFSKRAVSRIVEVFDQLHRRIEGLCLRASSQAGVGGIEDSTRCINKDVLGENRRLHDLTTELQGKHHKMSMEYNELQDKVQSAETKVSEMETTIEDLQWDIEKLRKREQKLNKHLAEALEQLNSGYHVSGGSSGFQGGHVTLHIQKFEMLNAELEENKELANSRMAELEKLEQELQEAVRENEKLKIDLRNVPEDVVKETTDYKCLQSQFSLLYNESLQVKTQLDEARALLLSTKNAHLRQIEHMESDELNLQKKLRTEVIQLEDTLAQVRKEYEMLRIEFEQNLAANEQAGPINREMRHLINSLQNHNHQLKGDVQRYKRKLREAQAEINKARMHCYPQLGGSASSVGPSSSSSAPSSSSSSGGPPTAPPPSGEEVKEEEGGAEVKKEPRDATAAPPASMSGAVHVKEEPAPAPGAAPTPTAEVKEEEASGGGSSAPPPPPPLQPLRREHSRAKDKEAEREKERERERGERDRGDRGERERDRGERGERDRGERGDRDRGDRDRERGDRDRERGDRERGDRERDRDKDKPKNTDEAKKKDSDLVKQLKVELKKAQESQKEMKLLLDMYKSAPKEQRDKAQLMAAERKAKAEVEEMKGRLKEIEEKEKKDSKRLADDDALKKIKFAEEQIDHLQKKLAATKQEEEALLSEMDVTGQAFEDMQEQNIRLMQQLREKDDANFKLMSERIKSNQIHKLLKEEKDELADQVLTLKTQVDAQLLVVQKLEEKERVLQSNLAVVEKELTLRSQALELNKRKAVEAAQLAEDLKVQLEHTQGKLKEIQSAMSDNRSAKEKESFNLKRAQEDLSRLRRKLEKQKKVEVFSDADEILMEEIKEYKAKLTCPCCNTRKKDAVLTKCFHVFCFECVKTRYDTRQRKCPKCNAAFGANDFHRIYIS